MAYHPSTHRQRLVRQLNEIKTKAQQADGPGVSTDLRDYAIAAAIFLSHAELENYFVDSLDGMADVYSQAANDASMLPVALRSHLISEKLGLGSLATKIVTKVGGEQSVLSAIERWFSSADFVLLTGARPLCQIAGVHIYGDYTYPSIKNIERILRRLGIGDPKGSLNRQVGRDVVALLESLASLRTALAHSGALPGINVMDVVTRVDELAVFVEAFDRALYEHTNTTLSDQDWHTLMC